MSTYCSSFFSSVPNMCLTGTGAKGAKWHQRGQARKVHAYWGKALSGTYVCRAYSIVAAFQEPRSRFPGACGGRGLSDLACLQTAGLYERPSSARVTERVRLPLAIRPGVDKPVHGQRTSILGQAACPHHAHSLLHTPAVNGVAFLIGSSIVQFCYLRRLFFKIVVAYQTFLPFR